MNLKSSWDRNIEKVRRLLQRQWLDVILQLSKAVFFVSNPYNRLDVDITLWCHNTDTSQRYNSLESINFNHHPARWLWAQVMDDCDLFYLISWQLSYLLKLSSLLHRPLLYITVYTCTLMAKAIILSKCDLSNYV